MKDNELQRYYDSFIELVEWYRDANTNVEKLNYLIEEWYHKEDEFVEKHKEYRKLNEWDDDLLDYDDWKEEHADEIEDEIYEAIRESNEPLDIQVYKNTWSMEWEYKADIQLARWWPNIMLTLDSRFERVQYWIYWWWDKLERDCNYLYDTIVEMYSVECY